MKNKGIRYEDRPSFKHKLTSRDAIDEDLMQVDKDTEDLMMTIDTEELMKCKGNRHEDRSSFQHELNSHDTMDEDVMNADKEIEELMMEIDTEQLGGLVM